MAVLSCFCLVAPVAKVTALVGGSGCGKSTIVSLVERIYNVQAGAVCVDGVDVQNMDVTRLQRQVAL